MLRDMSFYMFGHVIDPFFQQFIFEPIVVSIIAIIIAAITKRTWTIFVTIIIINLIDNAIDVNFLFGQEGIGVILVKNIVFFFSNFFSMFYEVLISLLVVSLPFVHKKLGIA